jgi:hypothetical protein
VRHLIENASGFRTRTWCGLPDIDACLAGRVSEVTCYGCLRSCEQHLRHELRAVLEQQHLVGRP